MSSSADTFPILLESSTEEIDNVGFKSQSSLSGSYSGDKGQDHDKKDSIHSEKLTQSLHLKENNNKKLVLEPGLLLIILGLSALHTTLQNLILFKVERIASMYGLYWALIETIPSIFFAIFLGSWSDKYGRKIPLILCSTGFLLSAIIVTIFGCIDNSPIEYLLLSPAILSLLGGLPSLLMSTFSMISDVTPPERRSMRIAIADAALFGVLPFGTLISGVLFDKYGFEPVFYLSCALSFLGLLYIVVFVQETVERFSDVDKKTKFLDLFDITNFRNSLIVCFKKREGRTRTYIILLIFCLALLIMPYIGEWACDFLYVQIHFQWSQVDFSYFSSFRSIIGILGVAIAMPIATKILMTTDLMMAIIGTTSKIIQSVAIPFINLPWVMYAVSGLNFFTPLCIPVVRSQISKLVDPEELGKVFAVIGAVESAVNLLASSTYSLVYKDTVGSYPGTIYFLSAGFTAISTIIFIFLYVDKKKSSSHKRLSEQNHENDLSVDG